MELIIALAASVLFASLFKVPIKKFPWAFYILAAIIAAVFASHILFEVAPMLSIMLYPYIQRCLIGFGLIAVVMFIGVFSEKSRIYIYFIPIRGELSIIGGILTLGHVLNYLNAYLKQMLSGFVGMAPIMIISFMISFILILMLIALTITSFTTIKKRMRTSSWRRLQLLAYPFFILIYFHLFFILAPANFSWGSKASISIGLYTVIIVSYIVLRIRRALVDRKRSELLSSK